MRNTFKWFAAAAVVLVLLGLAAFALADVAIDETHFPDPNFRAVAQQFDTDGDGSLSDAEISAVTNINCMSRGISSLKGVEYFSALQDLFCNSNRLTELDVSQNTALTFLWCHENQLTALDVSKNTALTDLNCSGNQLTALDVSRNTALKDLGCGSNRLTALDISRNTLLTGLGCSVNQLTELDVSKCTALIDLGCDYNQLISLNVSGNTELMGLHCSNNQLTALDVSNCPVICRYMNTYERVSNNTCDMFGFDFTFDPIVTVIGNYVSYPTAAQDVAIDETHFPDDAFRAVVQEFDTDGNGSLSGAEISAVNQIDCREKGVSNLKGVEYFVALKKLDCASNQLMELDVSRNIALTWLQCGHNQLTTLDVSSNTMLEVLDFNNNRLTALDVSSNTALRVLWCHNNRLTKLNVEKCPVLCGYMDDYRRTVYEDSAYIYEYFGIEEYGFPALTFDSSVTVTGSYVSYPTEVTVNGGVYKLSGTTAALIGASKKTLTSLVIPATVKANGKTYKVTAIEKNALKGMKKLKTVTVGKNVKTIGKSAMMNCTALTAVKGMAAVTEIGAEAFRDCAKLAKFTFEAKVKSIGKNAFYGCKKLKTIVIKTTKLTEKNVGTNAFKGTPESATVTCPASKLKAYKKFLVKRGISKKATFK